MPRLFNSANCLFQTFAVASLDSDATATATFTGLTTKDYIMVLQHNSLVATAQNSVVANVSAANIVMFHPSGAPGAGSSLAQTVGVLVMVNPTSGEKGGSW
jgi:hypothetical protein